jgi:multidrug resistance efflux pump
VADRLKEFLTRSAAPETKVAIDATTNSIIVAAQSQHQADIKKLITALDRPEENRALQTELKLLELDLAEAKLSVEEAEEDFARVQELKARNAITQQEVRQKQLQVERAKIQMQRIMIKLEAAKELPRATM